MHISYLQGHNDKPVARKANGACLDFKGGMSGVDVPRN